MINRELSQRLAAGRDRRLTQLADAATRWGGQAPEDPRITELADLLEIAAPATPQPDPTAPNAQHHARLAPTPRHPRRGLLPSARDR